MTTAPPVEPDDQVVAQVREIFTDVLAGHPVGDRDSLFSLGGSSIDAMRIVDRVNAATDAAVPLEVFLLRPSVAELARAVARARRPAPVEPAPHGTLPILVPHSRVSVSLDLLPAHVRRLVATVGPPVVPDEATTATLPELYDRYPAPVRQWLAGTPVVAGYCASAGLAVEAVVRRQHSGNPVRHLVLLDPTFGPHAQAGALWQTLGLRAADLPRLPELTAILRELDSWRRTVPASRAAGDLPALLAALEPHVRPLCRLAPDAPLTEVERQGLLRDYRAWIRVFVAATRYEAPALAVPITVVGTTEYEWLGGPAHLRHSLHRHTGTVRVLRTPGEHEVVLFAPHTRDLFAELAGAGSGPGGGGQPEP